MIVIDKEKQIESIFCDKCKSGDVIAEHVLEDIDNETRIEFFSCECQNCGNRFEEIL